jgi:arylsulfatase A-like enzyme
VLVFVDDLGYGDLGCFGSPYIETPNIDQMASEGAKYTSFYDGAPICTPSRAALMTGSYPTRVGLEEGVLFPGDEAGLNPDEVTVAELLGEQGYATTCIGKWHLGDREPFLPTNHGFDQYFGVPYSNDMGAEHSGGEYRELPLLRDTDTVEAPVDQTTLTRRYAEEAVGFIEENAGDQPFFCYLPHTMPHVPLATSETFADVSKRGDYGDVVSEIDWSVGQILDTLDRCGIDEDTLVVFTSDNGPWLDKEIDGGSSGHLSEGKFTVWEGGPRVPAVARWPGQIPPGTVCNELVTAMDLLPTLAALAGTSPPADRAVDGADARDLLFDPEGGESPHDHYVYQTGGGDLNAVRDADGWKYHLDSDELYHLHADVEEEYDVADEHPETVDRLRAAAEETIADLRENQRPVGRPQDD